MSTEEPSQENLQRIEASDLIRGFLDKYKFLHEYRLQKLIFFADLFAAEKYGERLTDTDFMPFMYGSYSDDVSNVLQELEENPDVSSKTDMHHGKTVTAYVGDSVDTSDLNDEVVEIIEQVHTVTNSKSNEELAQASKDSWLYEETEYAEEMNFREYAEKVRDGEIESDIERFFPHIDETASSVS